MKTKSFTATETVKVFFLLLSIIMFNGKYQNLYSQSWGNQVTVVNTSVDERAPGSIWANNKRYIVYEYHATHPYAKIMESSDGLNWAFFANVQTWANFDTYFPSITFGNSNAFVSVKVNRYTTGQVYVAKVPFNTGIATAVNPPQPPFGSGEQVVRARMCSDGEDYPNSTTLYLAILVAAPGYTGSLYYYRSLDNGANWEGPNLLQMNIDTWDFGFDYSSTGVYISYCRNNNLYFRKSSNGSFNSFGPEQTIFNNT